MKAIVISVAALVATLSAGSVLANEALAQKKNCLACHTLDKKIVGPSYKDVAAKYKGQAGIEAKLAEKILKGGAGAWGPVPMPANPQVSADEAKQLAKWVMTIK